MTRIRFLRRQIDSYSRLKEITKAIQMVALARLKSLTYKVKYRQTQLWVIKKIFKDRRKFTFEPAFAAERLSFVFVTTDRSCCGILNTNVYKVAKELVFNLNLQQKRACITTIGTKGTYFLRRAYPSFVKLCVTDIGDEPLSLLLVQSIAEQIFRLDLFAEEYIIVHNRFISIAEQRVSYYRLYAPYIVAQQVSAYVSAGEKHNSFWCALHRLFNNGIYTLYELFIFFFCLVLLDALEENEYSELGARYRSMENSHNNIVEMLNSLILKYHKVRQEGITRDLIEIISAAESIIKK